MISIHSFRTGKCRLHSTGKYSLLIFLFVSHSALASFSDNLTIGNAKALSLGHAITADPPGIDSIHYNPAGLARVKGRQVHIKGVYGLFETNYEFGEYGEYMQGLRDQLSQARWPETNGVPPPEEEWYLYDEAYNSKSEVEGPTVMLPGGMVDLPFSGGFMGGVTYSPPGSKFTFGTNVYTPMMSGFHRADDDPGRFIQRRGAFTQLTYFSPSIGVEFSEELQVGFALNFNYVGFGLDLPVREPHLLLFGYGHPSIGETFCPDGVPVEVPDIYLCHTVSPYQEFAELTIEADQPLAFSYNFGLLWSPQPWLTLGLSYNSSLDAELKGDYTFPINPFFKQVLLDAMYGSLWPDLASLMANLGYPFPSAEDTEKDHSGQVEVKYELPQHINAGISLQLTPSWKFNIDYRWTEWSVFSDIQIQFDQELALLMLGELSDRLMNDGQNGIKSDGVRYLLGLQDVRYWGMGVEYQYSDRLVLRAGYEDRPSAVPSAEPNAFIPLNDGILYSLGFGYRFHDNDTLDFAMGYLSSKSHYPPCTAKLGNACDPTDVAYPVYTGQDIRSEVTFLLFEIMYSSHC